MAHAAILLSIVLSATSPAAGQDLAKPVRLMAEGKPIDAELGHAAKRDDRSNAESIKSNLTNQIVKRIDQRTALAQERETLAPRPSCHGSVWLYLRTAK